MMSTTYLLYLYVIYIYMHTCVDCIFSITRAILGRDDQWTDDPQRCLGQTQNRPGHPHVGGLGGFLRHEHL